MLIGSSGEGSPVTLTWKVAVPEPSGPTTTTGSLKETFGAARLPTICAATSVSRAAPVYDASTSEAVAVPAFTAASCSEATPVATIWARTIALSATPISTGSPLTGIDTAPTFAAIAAITRAAEALLDCREAEERSMPARVAVAAITAWAVDSLVRSSGTPDSAALSTKSARAAKAWIPSDCRVGRPPPPLVSPSRLAAVIDTSDTISTSLANTAAAGATPSRATER